MTAGIFADRPQDLVLDGPASRRSDGFRNHRPGPFPDDDRARSVDRSHLVRHLPGLDGDSVRPAYGGRPGPKHRCPHRRLLGLLDLGFVRQRPLVASRQTRGHRVEHVRRERPQPRPRCLEESVDEVVHPVLASR
ncbi:hypothetical protein [Streptomyces sp. NPDC048057]|uniref:hypothetical protein n=1 Tax=Streptomyces sp. NPDC048057 TaxID=3155628 RepID=UPI00340A24A2